MRGSEGRKEGGREGGRDGERERECMCVSLSLTHTHAHTHTMHARVHTHTHTHAHSHINISFSWLPLSISFVQQQHVTYEHVWKSWYSFKYKLHFIIWFSFSSIALFISRSFPIAVQSNNHRSVQVILLICWKYKNSKKAKKEWKKTETTTTTTTTTTLRHSVKIEWWIRYWIWHAESNSGLNKREERERTEYSLSYSDIQTQIHRHRYHTNTHTYTLKHTHTPKKHTHNISYIHAQTCTLIHTHKHTQSYYCQDLHEPWLQPFSFQENTHMHTQTLTQLKLKTTSTTTGKPQSFQYKQILEKKRERVYHTQTHQLNKERNNLYRQRSATSLCTKNLNNGANQTKKKCNKFMHYRFKLLGNFAKLCGLVNSSYQTLLWESV